MNSTRSENQKRIEKLILETKSGVEQHEWAVAKLLESARTHAASETSNRNAFPLRPSSALKSMRDLYYGLVNYYHPGSIAIDPIRNPILLDLGHSIEAHLVTHLQRAFRIEHRSHRVEYGKVVNAVDGSEIVLNGELDFCIVTESGETIICDSKSSAQFPFEKGDLPKEEHVAQINLYMHSTWARTLNISRAMVIYYNKNNSEIKFYEFTYSPELAEAVLTKFQQVHDAYTKGELPPREHVYGLNWQAAYSSYLSHDIKDFRIPMHERPIVQATEALDGWSMAEKVRSIALTHGAAVVEYPDGNQVWLEVGTKGLLLKQEAKNERNKKYGT